jgi:hypothetical protein
MGRVGWGGGGGGCNLKYFFFIFYLVWLILGCIPKIGFVTCLEVPGSGWWWWWWVLESKLSDQLWLSFSLALAKPNKRN